MQNELDFFLIDRVHCGGDQNWSPHWLTRLGGCSTVTACELAICLCRTFPLLRGLYPYEPENVTKDDFLHFMDDMYPFVHPGVRGLTDIAKYAHGLASYAESVGCCLKTHLLHGESTVQDAARFIMQSIDARLPVAYLMLNHRNPAFEDFEWHWFTVIGYDGTAENLHITAATYGQRFTLPLHSAWDTGHRWKGGLVSAGPTR